MFNKLLNVIFNGFSPVSFSWHMILSPETVKQLSVGKREENLEPSRGIRKEHVRTLRGAE